MQLNKTESLREAQKHLDQGRLTAAMQIYQKIVEGDSTDLAAISMLGDLYVKAGRNADAVEHFLKISDKCLRNGSAISAAYILRKVLKIDSTNPQALAGLGELEFQDKKLDRAHDNFIEAGAAFWNKGNINAAIQMNKRALEIVPESRLAKVALALIEREKQGPEPPAPQKQITRELSLPPVDKWPTGDLTPIDDLPDIMISISDGSDAVVSPGVMVNSEPQPESHLISLPAPATGALNPTKEALRLVETIAPPESVPQAEEDAIIEQIATAEFLVGGGQIEQAIAQLKENLHDRPDHIQIREKLKDIYLRSGMIEKASEECVNIAGIYAARGDRQRSKDYVTRARLLISPEPYSSPEELRNGNLIQGEETPEPSAGWSPEPGQPLTVM